MKLARVAYLVIAGEYSGRQVLGVFTERPKARAYQKAANGPDPEALTYGNHCYLEAYPLNPAFEDTLGAIEVVINEQGAVTWKSWRRDRSPAQKPYCTIWEHSIAPEGQVRFQGWGKDEESARRSAEELRRETVALHGFRDEKIRDTIRERHREEVGRHLADQQRRYPPSPPEPPMSKEEWIAQGRPDGWTPPAE